MPLGQRILQVTIDVPNGQSVTLDQELDLHVSISKNALAIQNKCDITVFNLTQSLRTGLFSQFTAWNKRQVETGGLQPSYSNVTVLAGYKNGGNSNTSVVFKGQVVQVDPVGAPPDLGAQITCYEHQVSKAAWTTGFAPTNGTFKEYVLWAGKQMGVSRVVCETSYDNTPSGNFFAATHQVSELLIDIQSAYRPNVAAFIDNDVLIVMDVNKVVSERGSVTIDEFVGAPMWTEYGVQFKTLFDPNIVLACAANLNSKINPALNNSYIISTLSYALSSRDTEFYVTASGSPPA
jgi:hypothetical protein